jgi:xanthine dehydrogenase molybdopterin-binding subunit B
VTLRIVAEHAHIWNGFGDPERAAHKSRILDEWCEKVGRDPAEIERSILVGAEQVDKGDAYVEKGVTHPIFRAGGPDYDLEPLKKLIARRDSRNGG